jgi:hypothetical protein
MADFAFVALRLYFQILSMPPWRVHAETEIEHHPNWAISGNIAKIQLFWRANISVISQVITDLTRSPERYCRFLSSASRGSQKDSVMTENERFKNSNPVTPLDPTCKLVCGLRTNTEPNMTQNRLFQRCLAKRALGRSQSSNMGWKDGAETKILTLVDWQTGKN